MGPLSAVAISVFLLLFGLAGITWITISPKALGVVALIAMALILIDTFWARSGSWIGTRRRNDGQ
jgi:hypothetical protein